MKSLPVVVITGASSGIGRCLVHEFVNRGPHHFVFIGRSLDALNALGAEIRTSTFEIAQCELNSPSSTRDCLQILKGRHPKIEWLVNCAGFGFQGDISHQSLASQDEMIGVNVRSYLDVFTILRPNLGRGSKVMNVISSIAFVPARGYGLYGATKVFLLHWSLLLRAELKSQGIFVTAVCPGPVRTPFFERAGMAVSLSGIFIERAEKTAQRAIDATLKNRAIVSTGMLALFVQIFSRFFPLSMIAGLPPFVQGKKNE
jgi:short-subunit dehydrogenase